MLTERVPLSMKVGYGLGDLGLNLMFQTETSSFGRKAMRNIFNIIADVCAIANCRSENRRTEHIGL